MDSKQMSLKNMIHTNIYIYTRKKRMQTCILDTVGNERQISLVYMRDIYIYVYIYVYIYIHIAGKNGGDPQSSHTPKNSSQSFQKPTMTIQNASESIQHPFKIHQTSIQYLSLTIQSHPKTIQTPAKSILNHPEK